MSTRFEEMRRIIADTLLESKFLNAYSLDEEKIHRFLYSDHFHTSLMRMIEEKNYHSRALYEAMLPLLEEIMPQDHPENVLDFIYKFALRLAFPDAMTFDIRPEMDAVCHMYLRALRMVSEFQKTSGDDSWQSTYAMIMLQEHEIEQLEDDYEYRRFLRAFHEEYTYELMKLNQEVVGYSTLDHVCGVHHLAMKVARQLKKAGIPLDMGRVSGAAAGHDVGKYGCKKEEQKRVAYYHYYYTGEWFKRRDIVYIRNVAINHSTWDLELENLPIEALVLIYSDFRVKSDENRMMKFYTLDDSFQVILDKLDNVDEVKELRYRRVYRKLKDFEEYMLHLGVDVDPDSDEEISDEIIEFEHYSLLQGKQIIQNAKYASIAHNIKLMHHLRDENSLNKMLESARDLGDLSGLRGYIEVLEEYHPYLTQKQKLIVTKFLYDQLIMPEEDIRKQCAALLGVVIGTYDEELRKELPKDVALDTPEVMSLDLFKKYLDAFFYPDQKIIGKHRDWISYASRSMVRAYFAAQSNMDKKAVAIEVMLDYLRKPSDTNDIRYYLLASVPGIPFDVCTEEQKNEVIDYVYRMVVDKHLNTKLAAFRALDEMIDYAKDRLKHKYHVGETLIQGLDASPSPALNFARLKLVESLELGEDIQKQYAEPCKEDIKEVSSLFLSNLKSATHFIAKRFQVDLLVQHTLEDQYDNAFYTAMHFCNLLKVSAVETVRNRAGVGLIELVPNLSFEQRNDIVVELLRALEMESYQFTRYIPQYLGRILMYIKPGELDEILDSFQEKVKSANAQITTLMIQTVGFALSHYSSYKSMCEEDEEEYNKRLVVMLGILFNGFVNYNPVVNQVAFRVIGQRIFESRHMDRQMKLEIFKISIKKIMALMVDTDESIELVFFNNAAGLKNIYRFISDYVFEEGTLDLPENRKVAFFPGAFDPFSLSHKEIAKAIRDLGFEVYLAVDEFSWSKRTQPNLIRRDIIKMSVADEIDIYTYPRYLPTNIANAKDLEELKYKFKESDVHIVVGGDVIVNASAYRKPQEDTGITSFKHIVFDRKIANAPDRDAAFFEAFDRLPEGSVRLQLPEQFSNISSTQIRNYIDDNRDISELVDPLAQRFIYERGLYQREPMYKEVLTTKSLTLEIVEEPTPTLLEELATVVKYDFSKAYTTFKEFSSKKSFRLLVLRSVDDNRRIIGFSAFHWLRTIDIYVEFEDEYLSDYIRDHSVGRLVVIDGIYRNARDGSPNVEQRLLTETLAFCLAKDYSYAIYKDMVSDRVDTKLNNVLRMQGFLNVLGKESGESVYVVNMSTPCTLNMDARAMLKAPFRNSEGVLKALSRSRIRLQKALTKLYPGNLVLSFDRTMIYEHLIKKICDENNMPTTPLTPKTSGDAMCVPFGQIFNRWRLPNTVTKSLHTEKYFTSDLRKHEIMAAPYYLDLENQVKTIKSFDRPVMLVDDLLNKGYRINVLEPLFKQEKVEIKKFFVGILSGRGKAIMERANIEVDSAYFIPRLKVWFTESKMYPFIGGDILWRGVTPERSLIPSINLILPYTYPSYIRDASKHAVYKVSEIALINAIDILETIEEEYQTEHERMLTVSQLGEAILSPRIPDKGSNIDYDMNQKASEYLKNELEHLRRLRSVFQ